VIYFSANCPHSYLGCGALVLKLVVMQNLPPGRDLAEIPVAKRNAALRVEWANSPAELQPYREKWDALARAACEPNPFYEPWQLLPAWQRWGRDRRLRVALVFRPGAKPNLPDELCGLFPLVEQKHGRWPINVWRLWQHVYCFCCNPLIRHDAVRECWQAVWQAVVDHPDRPQAVEMSHVCAEGPLAQGLLDLRFERNLSVHIVKGYNRALIRRAGSSAEYLADTLTNHHRQELRRQHRRLTEQGTVEVRISGRDAPAIEFLEPFLELERRGWKGTETSALASDPAHADYFRELVTAGARTGQVSFLGLYLNDRPIALKVNLTSGGGAFAFKIAYDEAYAKYSPGVHLETENIAWLHEQPSWQWMDSCAVPGHFMIGRLWRERRSIQHVLMSCGHFRGELWLGMLAGVRAIRAIGRNNRRSQTPTASSTVTGGSAAAVTTTPLTVVAKPDLPAAGMPSASQPVPAPVDPVAKPVDTVTSAGAWANSATTQKSRTVPTSQTMPSAFTAVGSDSAVT
jgi:hypothetical protein